MTVHSRAWALAACLGAALLVACDGGGAGDPAPDVGDTEPQTDAAPDVAPDPDMAADAAPEPEPDMAADAAPEPEPDMAADAEPEPDADPDAAPDPEPDLGPGCEDGETRPCDADDDCQGQQSCVDGVFGPCRGPAEVCDGADTDCNGVIDDVEGAGEPCTAGVGACAVDGVMACGPGGALACDAAPGAPADEICASGTDEDCDGATDEDPCTPVCAGDGDCADGERCVDEQCVGPAPEACDNGIDDDFDGAIDCDDDACIGDPVCPPPGACDLAVEIPGAGLYAGDTTGAPSSSRETDPDCIESAATFADSPEAVFVLRPDADGALCLSTLGSRFDTVLYVRAEACDDPAAEVACNDDNEPLAGGTRSALTLAAAAGATYFVFVDGYGGFNEGPFTLRISPGPCAPPVEICDNGVDDDLDPRVDCDDPSCFGTDVCLDQRCGDGALDPGEACDDGGRAPGDGCDAACLVEVGYVCERPDPQGPSVCRPRAVCGDGALDDPELCDDGNADDGDGCDAVCTPEVFDAVQGIERFEHAFPEGGADGVRFTVDHDPSRLIARTSDGFAGCPGDTVLDVFPVDAGGVRGALLATDDDGGEGGCALLDAALAPGAYELVVRGLDGRPLAGVVLDYRLEVDIDAGGDYAGALPLGGSDLYVFELDGPAAVTLETGDGAGACPGDTVVRLFGFDGEGARVPVAVDDDGGLSPCSLLISDLGPGRYEVEIDEFDRDEAIDAYRLAVAITRPVCGNGAVEAGETCDDGGLDDGDGCDAVCTAELYDVVRAIARLDIAFGQGGADAVRFTVDHDPSRLIAEAGDGVGGCPGDTVLDLYPIDAAGVRGAIVGSDDDGGIGDCSRLDIELAPGDYELVARGFNGIALAGLVLDHRLEVDIGAGGTYDGAVSIGGDDLYVFTLEAPTVVTLETGDGAGGCPGDTRLTVFGFDPDGARIEVGFDDDGGLETCSLVELELQPGAYEVEVDEFLRDAPLDYVLQARIGPEPAPAVEVSIVDFAMAPDPLFIQVGQTVRWTNLDQAIHTVTSGEPGTALAGAIFDSGNLRQGDTFEYTFLSAGEFLYFCRPHSGFMRDYRVIVEGPPDPDQGACEESCADLQACFGIPPDPRCVDGCLSGPANRATGRCLAERLDPGAGQCDFAVLQACNNP